MYNIFYIYTYKYTKPSNMLTLSLSQCPHGPRLHKQPDQTHQQAKPQAIYIWAKMHKPHNATKPYSRATCTYAAILKSCIMRSVFQFCLCFVTTLKIFCNFFVICRAKWVYTYVGKLKIDIIRTYIRPKALAL